VLLDLVVSRDQLVQLVHLGNKEIEVSQVTEEQQVTEALQVLLVPQEIKDQLVLKDQQDSLDLLEHLGHQEIKELQEIQVNLEMMDNQVTTFV